MRSGFNKVLDKEQEFEKNNAIDNMVKELQLLAFTWTSMVIPMSPLDHFFYKRSIPNKSDADPILAYVEFGEIGRKLLRLITLGELEKRQFPIHEIVDRQEEPEIITILDVSEVTLQVEELRQEEIVHEVKDLGLDCGEVVYDGWSILRQFDTTQPDLSKDYVVEMVKTSFPSRIPWTSNPDKYKSLVSRYHRETRKFLKMLTAADKERVELSLQKIHSRGRDLNLLRKVYSVNDEVIKGIFFPYIARRLSSLLDRLYDMPIKTPRYSAVHKYRDKSLIVIETPLRRFRLHRDLWRKLCHRSLEEIYSMLMYYAPYITHKSNFFSSVPCSLYEHMQGCYAFDGEMFASPLCFKIHGFCSLREEDSAFGGSGSIFTRKSRGGRWMCNPPFLFEIIDRLVSVIRVMSSSAERFSLILILPEAYCPRSERYSAELRAMSTFKGSQILTAANACYDSYLSDIDIIGKRKRYLSKCNTQILFFTNEPEDNSVGPMTDFVENWAHLSRSSIPHM
jgi:hypothetical protein